MKDNVILFIKFKEGDNMKITKEKMQKIEKHVEKILGDKDFSNSPYVDIVSIVEKEGFSVITSLMPIETTGCIFVEDDKNERIIIVNKVFKNPDNEIDCVFKKADSLQHMSMDIIFYINKRINY